MLYRIHLPTATIKGRSLVSHVTFSCFGSLAGKYHSLCVLKKTTAKKFLIWGLCFIIGFLIRFSHFLIRCCILWESHLEANCVHLFLLRVVNFDYLVRVLSYFSCVQIQFFLPGNPSDVYGKKSDGANILFLIKTSPYTEHPFIDGSRLTQSLPQWLQNDDCPTLAQPPYLPVSIQQATISKRTSFFSICFIDYIYDWYGSMDFFFKF